MDTSGWFAYVKYKDNEKEKVPISKISDVNDKGQKIPFQPKDLNDYVYGKLYSVRTSLRSKDGKESKYYAVIGKLAESLEAINAVRPRWPDLQIDDEEPESTGVEDQEENINYCIQKNKDQVKIKKNKKRKASNKELELFIENNVLNEKVFDKNITIEAAKKKTKNDKTYDEDNIQVENKKHKFIYRNSTETKYLQEKILQLENELKEKDEALSFINNPQVKYLEKFFEKKMMELEERLKKNLEKKVIDVFEESVITKLDQKISSIEDIMKTHLSSFTPTSSSVASEDTSESEEKVHLGEGIMCSKYAHQILSTVKEHSDWAVALLIGVYGDNARNMRYGKPRSSNLQSFSRYFVNVAKYHYRKWLESLTIGNTEDRKYSSAQIEDLINSLPTYLSKRCIDMNGPRLKKAVRLVNNHYNLILIEKKDHIKGEALCCNQFNNQ
ncbi:putative leucine-rich repeat-containing protein DDB_G0290503 [Linepithema humile]|uniref:putative leucine-rich repeat-containing protein DDB_G0290503 n=1 Tax=Linepithema humile TaxID=83485 RepID=UPI00351E0F13